MASGNRHGSSSNGFCFFRIIFKETLEREMLELPQKFVRLYGESLSNSVVLKPPFGSTWKIGLEKRDGKVRLQQGWPEFTKHYALGFGHLLFFRYKGNSQFQLSICDITTCEISSPSIPAHLDECDVNESKKEETEGDRDAVQVFDSSSSGEEDLPSSSPHHKRMRASASGQGIKTASGDKFATRRWRKPKVHTKTRSQTPTGEDKTLGSGFSNNDFSIHPLGQAEETRSQNPQFKFGKFKSGDHRVIGRLTPLRFRESKAYEAANKFFSKNPFCKTIVTNTYVARLPSAFARRLEQKAQTIRLEVGNSSWPVQFTNCNSGSFLSGGYSKFRTENSLHRGDVCIFELNKRKDQREVVYKVYIFRNNML